MMERLEFQRQLEEARQLAEKRLGTFFTGAGLEEAMRYSLMAGGKRIRPILAMKFCQAAGGGMEEALDFGCGLEMLHTYSLIHDDLPCMDDDELRRGRPTCHVKYGEWLALLAGDALQAAAFERLALSARTSPGANAKACGILATAAGRHNMCAGQYLDIAEEGQKLDEKRVTQIHLRKTSALLGAACLLGLTASPEEPSEGQWSAALDYARELGLAFQIRDDMLDVESTAEELGKPVGSDLENGKSTFATLFGLEKCAQLVAEHTRLAKQSVSGAFEKPEFLCALADSLAERKN